MKMKKRSKDFQELFKKSKSTCCCSMDQKTTNICYMLLTVNWNFPLLFYPCSVPVDRWQRGTKYITDTDQLHDRELVYFCSVSRFMSRMSSQKKQVYLQACINKGSVYQHVPVYFHNFFFLHRRGRNFSSFLGFLQLQP